MQYLWAGSVSSASTRHGPRSLHNERWHSNQVLSHVFIMRGIGRDLKRRRTSDTDEAKQDDAFETASTLTSRIYELERSLPVEESLDSDTVDIALEMSLDRDTAELSRLNSELRSAVQIMKAEREEKEEREIGKHRTAMTAEKAVSTSKLTTFHVRRATEVWKRIKARLDEHIKSILVLNEIADTTQTMFTNLSLFITSLKSMRTPEGLLGKYQTAVRNLSWIKQEKLKIEKWHELIVQLFYNAVAVQKLIAEVLEENQLFISKATSEAPVSTYFSSPGNATAYFYTVVGSTLKAMEATRKIFDDHMNLTPLIEFCEYINKDLEKVFESLLHEATTGGTRRARTKIWK